MEELIQQAIIVLKGMWRHRLWGVVAAWAVFAVGTLAVMLQKDVYEANAKVYVDAESQLRLLLDEQIVDSDLEEKLRFVREALLSRPQLEAVAMQTGMINEASTEAERSAAVERLFNRMDIISSADLVAPRMRGGRRSDDTYSITYQDNSYDQAINVVETLINAFVANTLTPRANELGCRREFPPVTDQRL